jgi:hypothetical protein
MVVGRITGGRMMRKADEIQQCVMMGIEEAARRMMGEVEAR